MKMDMKSLLKSAGRYFAFLRSVKLEAVIWMAGLAALAFIDPYSSEHLSICPLHNLGFDFCPGCGLGRAISFLFRGDITASFEAHPLGIPALLILCHRIFVLLYCPLKSKNSVSINMSGGNHG
jgi:hypothetical protein